MAAAATARESARLPNERRRPDIKLLLFLVFQLAAFAFAYGKLVERVDSMQQAVHEIREDVREMRRVR